jgi:hypothetical protein
VEQLPASLKMAEMTFLTLDRRSSDTGAGGLQHVTRHTSHVTRHTSHVTRHTSHVTRHTSHVTRHTSHVTRHPTHRDGTGITVWDESQGVWLRFVYTATGVFCSIGSDGSVPQRRIPYSCSHHDEPHRNLPGTIITPLQVNVSTGTGGRRQLRPRVVSRLRVACAATQRLLLTFELSHFACGYSHVTSHMSHVTRHMSHVTRHTSHVTRHTSHVTGGPALRHGSVVAVLLETAGESEPTVNLSFLVDGAHVC